MQEKEVIIMQDKTSEKVFVFSLSSFADYAMEFIQERYSNDFEFTRKDVI